MSSLNQKLITIATKVGLFPNIVFIRIPHKIHEFKEVEKNITFLKTDNVLDLGCGPGIQTLCLGKKCRHIIGLDVEESAVRRAKHSSSKIGGKISSEFICGSLEEAAFPNDHFDKVFSICVIEHISNYEEVINEIYRILKPGGVFVFSVDSLATIDSLLLRNKHKQNYGIQKYFSKNELSQILGKNGFKNIHVNPILKSEFAKKIFSKGIKNDFKIQWTFMLDYLWLSLNEKRSKNTEGIFIVAKGTK
jgi:ubiquinone/menaquinone biosynthesis C-methylase UbiE